MEKVSVKNFEEILKNYVGGFSRFQLCFGAMILLGTVGTCGNLSFMAFGGSDVKEKLPKENCTEVFEEKMKNGTIIFQADFYSLVAQWGLVCDTAYMNELATSIGLGGKLVGALFAGHIADMFGRKWVFYSAFILLEIAGFASAFSPSWAWFCALRFVNSFGLSVVESVVMVAFVECVDEKHRVLCIIFSMWHIGYLSFAALAYATKHWQTLLLAINAVPLPLAVLYLSIPESTRWLIQKNRLEEAKKALKRVAKWNNRDPQRIDEIDLSSLRLEPSGAGAKLSYWQLFATRRRSAYSVTLALTRFFATLTNSVFVFGVGRLAGNPYLNLVIYVALWCWAPFIPSLLERGCPAIGRRLQYLLTTAFICTCFIAIVLIKVVSPNEGPWKSSVTGIFITATVTLTMLHVVASTYNAELFPTEMRCLSYSFSQLGSGFGHVLAPQLLYLGRFCDVCPPVVVAATAALLFCLGLGFLPETSGKPLTETAIQRKTSAETPPEEVNLMQQQKMVE